MEPAWIQDHLTLAHRLDRAYREAGRSQLVDASYGPPGPKAQAEAEPAPPPAELLRAARLLTETLPAQGFEPDRAGFLTVQSRAMETYARLLAGEALSLEEQLAGCLDLPLALKPEAELEQGMRLLDEALPGSGEVRARYAGWLERNLIPPERAGELPGLMERILAEVRHRTAAFAPLPEGEGVEAEVVYDRSYGAANWYQGGYRSKMELNGSRPVHLAGLLYQMAHEAYPGHHTEYTLKERALVREEGWTEHSLAFYGPQLPVSEGIATLALEAIFTPQEAADWMTADLFQPLGVQVDDYDLVKLFQASVLLGWDDLGGNLVSQIRDGRTDEEVVEYALAYSPYPETLVRDILNGYRTPVGQLYAFSYYGGKRLMRAGFEAEGQAYFRRVLTEAVYPSIL